MPTLNSNMLRHQDTIPLRRWLLQFRMPKKILRKRKDFLKLFREQHVPFATNISESPEPPKPILTSKFEIPGNSTVCNQLKPSDYPSAGSNPDALVRYLFGNFEWIDDLLGPSGERPFCIAFAGNNPKIGLTCPKLALQPQPTPTSTR
jgi:hypothetical protein